MLKINICSCKFCLFLCSSCSFCLTSSSITSNSLADSVPLLCLEFNCCSLVSISHWECDSSWERPTTSYSCQRFSASASSYSCYMACYMAVDSGSATVISVQSCSILWICSKVERAVGKYRLLIWCLLKLKCIL